MGSNRLGASMVGIATVTVLTLIVPGTASAHRSGCHRWHSCPSDTGSYTCGDLGYTSQCGGSSTNLTDIKVAALIVTGPSTVKVGESVVFQYDAKNAAGDKVIAVPTWSATGGSINYGVWLAPKKAGTYTITATADGVTSAFVVTVLPSAPSTITLEADSTTVSAGTPLTIRVTASDYYGNLVPALNATWFVQGVGEIRNGVFTSTKAGTADVTVLVNGISARKTIRVDAGPVRVMTLSPSTAVVKPGETVGFRVIAQDDFGNTVEPAKVEWTSTGGNITAPGFFKAGDTGGRGEIRASMSTTKGSVTATAVVTITGGTNVPATNTIPSQTKAPADVPADQGIQPKSTAQAQARVLERLKSLLEAGIIQKTSARENLAAAVSALMGEVHVEIKGKTDLEALTIVESALSAGTTEKTAAHLDILAEVQARLGKRSEARNTLRARLTINPLTRSAYKALLALEAETGERQDMDTFVGGKKIAVDVRPVIRNGQTLVPVRALVEALGASVVWDSETQSVAIRKGGTTVLLKLGSNRALVNGKEVLMDVPAVSEDGRTMIPARFVAEGLGLYVTWLADERAIVVTEALLE